MEQDKKEQQLKTKFGRRMQREHAMKIIYQSGFNSDFEEMLSLYLEENNLDLLQMSYFGDIVKVFSENKPEIDRILESCLHGNWNIKRLSKIDLAILETAIADLHYISTPYKVAINEAVELAKKYSDENAFGFVNGVLKTYIKKYSEDISDEA